jgi:hypothetical protein
MQSVPKWLMPVMFVGLGVPFTVWNVHKTNGELNALSGDEARQARCVEKSEPLLKVSHKKVTEFCRCIVHEAKAKGAGKSLGAYDEDKLKPIFDLCVQTELIQ